MLEIIETLILEMRNGSYEGVDFQMWFNHYVLFIALSFYIVLSDSYWKPENGHDEKNILEIGFFWLWVGRHMAFMLYISLLKICQ